MARDYAKQRATKKKQPRKIGRLIIAMLIVFIGGYFVAIFWDLDTIKKTISSKLAHVLPKSKPSVKQSPKKVELPKPKFEFYTTLPKDRVSSAEPIVNHKSQIGSTDVPSATKKKISNQYLLQVASFKHLDDADKLKAALILKGYDVKMTEFISGNSKWYRVNIGPFDSQDMAFKTQVKMHQDNRNLTGIIRRIV
jgi:cell division protein FtsN